VGATFTLEILIGATDPGPLDDVADLYSYQFAVSYDPLLLSAQSVSEGPFLSTAGPTFFIPGVIDDVAGLVNFNANTLLGPIAGVSGSGLLFSIDFKALAIGTSSVSPVFEPLDGDALLNSALQTIEPFSVVDSTVTIESSGSVPEPGMLMLLAIGAASLAVRFSRRRVQSNRAGNSLVPS
jgi:hypothetical protein